MSPFLQTALALAIVLAASKAAGALAKRFGQPAVLGELLAGLLLGPTLIDMLHLFPAADHVHEVVKTLAELGVVVLMFMAGLETDLGEMRKVGVASFVGATGGVFLPMAAGMGISMAFGYEFYESLFIGTVLTATSVSISAQTLLELGQLRSKAGLTTLGAAVIDDVMGIVILSIVIATNASQSGTSADPVWLVIIKMVAFFSAAIALGKWVVPKVIEATRRWAGEEVPFAITLALVLVFGVGAEVFGKVAAITGSYTLGVMIAQHHGLKHMIEERIKVLAYGFLVPVFFISIGLEGDLIAAMKTGGLAYMGLIIAASIVTKIVGSGLGVKLTGFSNMDSLRVGIGMISRGEVALIVAGIGLSAGIINAGIFSVMVVMTLVTTLVTPVLLRMVFPKAAEQPEQPGSH